MVVKNGIGGTGVFPGVFLAWRVGPDRGIDGLLGIHTVVDSSARLSFFILRSPLDDASETTAWVLSTLFLRPQVVAAVSSSERFRRDRKNEGWGTGWRYLRGRKEKGA